MEMEHVRPTSGTHRSGDTGNTSCSSDGGVRGGWNDYSEETSTTGYTPLLVVRGTKGNAWGSHMTPCAWQGEGDAGRQQSRRDGSMPTKTDTVATVDPAETGSIGGSEDGGEVPAVPAAVGELNIRNLSVAGEMAARNDRDEAQIILTTKRMATSVGTSETMPAGSASLKSTPTLIQAGDGSHEERGHDNAQQHPQEEQKPKHPLGCMFSPALDDKDDVLKMVSEVLCRPGFTSGPSDEKRLLRDIATGRVDVRTMSRLLRWLARELVGQELRLRSLSFVGPMGESASRPYTSGMGMSHLMDKLVAGKHPAGSQFVVCFSSSLDACAGAVAGTLVSRASKSVSKTMVAGMPATQAAAESAWTGLGQMTDRVLHESGVLGGVQGLSLGADEGEDATTASTCSFSGGDDGDDDDDDDEEDDDFNDDGAAATRTASSSSSSFASGSTAPSSGATATAGPRRRARQRLAIVTPTAVAHETSTAAVRDRERSTPKTIATINAAITPKGSKKKGVSTRVRCQERGDNHDINHDVVENAVDDIFPLLWDETPKHCCGSGAGNIAHAGDATVRVSSGGLSAMEVREWVDYYGECEGPLLAAWVFAANDHQGRRGQSPWV